MAETKWRPPQATREWRRRPLLSFGLRAVVFTTPTLAGLGAVALLASVIRRPSPLFQLAAWYLLITLAGVAALVLAGRATRRLLPLAALFRLSLLFPDHAPARFAVARRAARPRQILKQLDALGELGPREEAGVAQRVLELTVALSVHDRATRGHSERVQVITDMITRELHLPAEDRARLRWAALLHDVGKLRVPARVLNKPSQPDAREWAILRRHPGDGARIVAPLLSWLGIWGAAVAQHHEQFDGSGYPLGLSGAQISRGARIVAVADVFEVITAPRPYRRPVSVTAAREELVRVSGSQLDPKVVRALLNVSVGELWPVVGLGAVLCQLPLVPRIVGLFSRSLPALGGSAVAAGAAGALLVAGIAHPASLAPPARAPSLISQPPPRPGAQPTPPLRSRAAPPVSAAEQPPPVRTSPPAGQAVLGAAQPEAATPSSAPPPQPTTSSAAPATVPPPGLIPQLLTGIRSLLQTLGL